MSEDSEVAGIARRAADRLANDIDRGLRQDIERELAKDPLDQRPGRPFEPVSFGALIVSLASFGWTVYRDLKKDCDTAKADRPATEARPVARRRRLRRRSAAARYNAGPAITSHYHDSS